MMALGTFDSYPKEQLTDRPAHHFRLVKRLEESGRTFRGYIPFGSNDFPDEFVIGPVLGELLTEPACDGNCSRSRQNITINTQ